MAEPGWVVPARLQKARERLGLTPEEAAKRAGIPEERLRRWEEGEEAPTLEEAVALAEAYRCRLQTFLEPVEEPPARLDLRLGRAVEPEERKRLVQQAIADFERWCQTAALIEEMVGRREVRLTPIAERDPLVLAQVLRREYGLGTGPIRGLRRLVEEEMGVLVFRLPLEGVSGMSWWHPKAGPALLLNQSDSRSRQNWTLAHEVAHLISAGDLVLCDTFRINEEEQRERFANLFAAEFLVPEDDLRRYVASKDLMEVLRENKVLQALGRRYGVSREAIAWRLEKMGLLERGFTEAQRPVWLEEWARRERKRGRRKARRKQREEELGRALMGRAVLAYVRGKMTLSKLAEELDLGVIEAQELVEEWRARLVKV